MGHRLRNPCVIGCAIRASSICNPCKIHAKSAQFMPNRRNPRTFHPNRENSQSTHNRKRPNRRTSAIHVKSAQSLRTPCTIHGHSMRNRRNTCYIGKIHGKSAQSMRNRNNLCRIHGLPPRIFPSTSL